MTDKLDIYEVLSTLVPGVLLQALLPICFPQILSLHVPKLPDAYAVIVLVASSILLGQLVLALSSWIEPALYWSWGGKPSDVALRRGLGKVLPEETTRRIKQKLQHEIGEHASCTSLFLYAMQISDGAGLGRSPKFNALYAYHRTLVVALFAAAILLNCSAKWGALAHQPWSLRTMLVAGVVAALLLVWHRAKQRAQYYVREVLLTAERQISERQLRQVQDSGGLAK